AIIEWRSPEKRWNFVGDLRNAFVEYRNKLLEVGGPAVGHGGGSNGVLEYQVPSDDPRKQFTERCIGIRIRRARHRHHRSKFRVPKRSKDAGQARQDKREHQGRPRPVMSGNTGKNKNAGADNRANAKRSELYWSKDATEPILACHLIEEQAERFRC